MIWHSAPNIGSGFVSINPATELPTITGPVTINGTTQPGFAGTPIVELNGSGLSSFNCGLRLSGGNSTVRGLVINGFPGDGIRLSGSGGNVVEGNFIGTDVTGTLDRGNGFFGIYIDNICIQG
jgi:hypothetical protein